MSMPRHAIEGQVVLLAGARASVTLAHLSTLLGETGQYLYERREAYDRRFERIEGAEGSYYYLTDSDHWERLGSELGFEEREFDAVRRAHEAQFRRAGRQLGRDEEFESALDIREVAAIRPPGSRLSR